MYNRIIFIFALVIASCGDKICNPKCRPLNISDALPIQFWAADCDTYNEDESCGVHHKCFCQPWQCDDPIKLQIEDDIEPGFDLSIEDESDTEILRIPFDAILVHPPAMEALSGWENGTGAGDAWTEGPNPFTGELTNETNKYLKGTFLGKAGRTYNFSYNVTIDVGVGAIAVVYIRFLDANENVLDSEVDLFGSDGSFVRSVELSPSSDCTHIAVRVQAFSIVNNVTITAFTNESTQQPSGLYHLTFTPSEVSPDLCNKKVRMFIVSTASPEEIVAKSDCIEIQESHACTKSIEYSNNRNYAGLNYSIELSPETGFLARFPAIFYHERDKKEEEVIEITNQTVSLNSSTKFQRLFETGYMPDYMHRKLLLILNHQNKEIDAQEWVLEESYEKTEGDRRSTLKKAKVWLTEKEFIARNVL